METLGFEVKSSEHTQMIEITAEISRIVAESGVKDGICTVFIPHTTAAVTINENADPDVVRDFIMSDNSRRADHVCYASFRDNPYGIRICDDHYMRCIGIENRARCRLLRMS